MKACGGLSFIGTICEALQPSTECPTLILDLLAFDGWPSCYAISQVAKGPLVCNSQVFHGFELNSYFFLFLTPHSLRKFMFSSQIVAESGRKFAAGAVCHSGQSASFCGNLIAQKVFGMCRTEHLSLPGFPNFAEALRSLKAMDKVSCPNYEVCIALGNGTLVIKEALVELWSKKHAEFAAETEELLKNHNAEFNRENIKRGLEKSNESETKNEPIKKLCLEGTLEIDEFEKQHSDRSGSLKRLFICHWILYTWGCCSSFWR